MNCFLVTESDIKKNEIAFSKEFNQSVLRLDVYHDARCIIGGMTTEGGQFDGEISLTMAWRGESGYVGNYYDSDNSYRGA